MRLRQWFTPWVWQWKREGDDWFSLRVTIPWLAFMLGFRVPEHAQMVSGVTLAWRAPWWPDFKQRQWLKKTRQPFVFYGKMDAMYAQGAAASIGIRTQEPVGWMDMLAFMPTLWAVEDVHRHQIGNWKGDTWIATCPQCAARALRAGIENNERLLARIAELEQKLEAMGEQGQTAHSA